MAFVQEGLASGSDDAQGFSSCSRTHGHVSTLRGKLMGPVKRSQIPEANYRRVANRLAVVAFRAEDGGHAYLKPIEKLSAPDVQRIRDMSIMGHYLELAPGNVTSRSSQCSWPYPIVSASQYRPGALVVR